MGMTSNEVEITGYKPNELGEQEIIVSYNGKTTKFTITIKNNKEDTPSTSNDKTVSKTILPQTGSKMIIQGIVLIAFVLISVVSYILYKKIIFNQK